MILRRHPFAVAAHFRHSLVLAYALPPDELAPLLPPRLVLDVHGGRAFAAVAMVATERLRPAFLPAALGLDFSLVGRRIFVRVEGRESLRGLYILSSDTDRRLMVGLGNAFTHYRYRLTPIAWAHRADALEVRLGDELHVTADVATEAETPPPGSPFATLAEARRFSGPLPYTFGVHASDNLLLAVRGMRSGWETRPVHVDVRGAPFGPNAVLANAFHVADVDYRWERGRVL